MNVLALPDGEALVLDALRHYLPTQATFHVEVPADWNKKTPYSVVTRIPGGKSKDPRFISHALFSVQAVATTRKAASVLARQIQAALLQARLDNFGNDEGWVADFQVTKEPVPVRDGLSGKHPDSFLFDATYTLWFGARV